MAEFALPAAGVAQELPAAASPPPNHHASIMRRAVQPSMVIGDERHHVHSTANKHDLAANGSAQAHDLEAAGVEGDPLLHQFEDMTLAAAKAAKNYRFLMLEHMKINMAAALSCVNGLATANSKIASTAHCVASESEAVSDPQGDEETAPKAEEVADEYRVKAFEVMTANMNSTLEYAQRLAHVKTPSELVELATSQVRKQFDLMMQQTGELGSIVQRLKPHDIASLTAGFGKLIGEAEE